MNQTTITILTNFFPWGFIKLVILTLMVMYIIFAGVIVRQEQLMAKVVEVPSSPLLRVIAIAHLIASITVFLLALILL